MLASVLQLIPVIFGVLVIFNLIIVVHELGHFLAARWRGLVVEEFGVWFGKAIWRKKFNGVWYSLGTIPAGGFVKLPQLAPMKTIEGESETPRAELPPIKPLDKIIVAFAGPLFSFLLALALACIIWNVGKPYRQEDNTTTVGIVVPGGPADQAGLRPGDKILAIDGKPVTKFMGPVNSVIWGIVSSEGEKIDFLVEREGKELHILSGWSKEETAGWRRKALRKVKIGPLMIPEIGLVTPGGPGEAAGLQKGDLVTEVNGTKIISLDQLAAVVQKTGVAPLVLTVQRNGQPVQVTLTPRPPKAGEEAYGPDLGLEWGSIKWDYPTPWEQVVESVKSIGNMLRSATSMKSDVKAQHFSGPIGIMNLYKRILQSEQPLQYAIAFSVFFNVNLALINLLPLPVLDGGHIMLGLIEMIRRRPVRNIRIMEIMETACTLLILGFILYVSFFDLGDFIPHKTPPPEVQATPAPK
jgi:regulator of sigma E protease